MKYKILLPLVVSLLILPAGVSARLPVPPQDYTITTDGGQYVFVMLANIPRGEPDARIRARYARSGLYQNNGAKDPLWTVDWFAPRVDIAADGQQLVAWNRQFVDGRPDQTALAFYDHERPIASYRVDQLVTIALLPRGEGCCRWQTARSFDARQGRLTIETRDGEQLVFDLRTGSVLSGFVPAVSRASIIGGAILLGGLISVYLGAVLRRNRWRERLINKWAAPRPLI
jgi:hypothetical protein